MITSRIDALVATGLESMLKAFLLLAEEKLETNTRS
jgi:hypothetical protein